MHLSLRAPLTLKGPENLGLPLSRHFEIEALAVHSCAPANQQGADSEMKGVLRGNNMVPPITRHGRLSLGCTAATLTGHGAVLPHGVRCRPLTQTRPTDTTCIQTRPQLVGLLKTSPSMYGVQTGSLEK